MGLTQRLQSSSFLVMTYFLLREYIIQPKKELLWSLWVGTTHNRVRTLLIVAVTGLAQLTKVERVTQFKRNYK